MQLTLYYSEEDCYLLRLVDEKAQRERKSRSAVIMAILESFLEQDKKLGEILVDMGMVTQSQVEEALKEQNAGVVKKRIGEILVSKGLAEEEVRRALLVQERARGGSEERRF